VTDRETLHRIEDEAALEAAFASERAVLYKHSPICGSSLLALSEVRRFAESHPDTPVFFIDVVDGRALSEAAAERLQVTHESPQVILMARGTPMWSASHREVKAVALAAQVDE
jgi:bacillithiol system protein YtxJ